MIPCHSQMLTALSYILPVISFYTAHSLAQRSPEVTEVSGSAAASVGAVSGWIRIAPRLSQLTPKSGTTGQPGSTYNLPRLDVLTSRDSLKQLTNGCIVCMNSSRTSVRVASSLIFPALAGVLDGANSKNAFSLVHRSPYTSRHHTEQGWPMF